MGDVAVGDRVRIVRPLDGDDTPVGTTGTVISLAAPGNSSMKILLDGEFDDCINEYFTSIDGDDWELIIYPYFTSIDTERSAPDV